MQGLLVSAMVSVFFIFLFLISGSPITHLATRTLTSSALGQTPAKPIHHFFNGQSLFLV